MTATLEDLKNFKVYNRDIYLPVVDDDRKNNSVIFLLTPTFESSMDHLYNLKFNGARYKGSLNWQSYYLERDISFYIHENTRMMDTYFDQLIEEEGNLEVRDLSSKGLSQFYKVPITEDNIDEYRMKSDMVCGIVEYLPWKGYFYTTENEDLVAGLSVNIEEHEISKMFVVDEKYNYLYKDLIDEARKLKANEMIIENDNSAMKYLKEYGFSEMEKYNDGKVKMQFKIPIEEGTSSSDFFKLNRYLYDKKNSYKQYYKDQYVKFQTDALLHAVEYYKKEYDLDNFICALMVRCFYEGDPFAVTDMIKKDTQLRKVLDPKQITIACMAIIEGSKTKGDFDYMDDPIDKGFSTIYSRVLNDMDVLIHKCDINVIVYDEIKDYKRDEHISYIQEDDVDKIANIIRKKHGKYERFILSASYTYYRKESAIIKSRITSDYLEKKIREIGKVTVAEETQGVIGQILQESHITFGYQNENFITPSSDDEYNKLDKSKNNEKAFYEVPGVKRNKEDIGLVIRDGGILKGSVTVNPEKWISSVDCSDVDFQHITSAAIAKYGANKIKIPYECGFLIESALRCSNLWECVKREKDGFIFESHYGQYPYPDIPLDEDSKEIYESLPDKEKIYLGNQYLNENCLSNTIYRNTIKGKGMVDVYMNPWFLEVGNIDIAVLPEYRGKGYSSRLIREAEEYVKKNMPKIKMLCWIAEENNEASLQLARKLGYVPYYKQCGCIYNYKAFESKYKEVMMDKIQRDNKIEESGNILLEEDNQDIIFDKGLEKYGLLHENSLMIFQEAADRMLTSGQYNKRFRKVLYNDRIRTSKQILSIHKEIKNHAGIKYCYTTIDRYKNKNLFVDLGYYNRSFFTNWHGNIGISKPDKRLSDLYLEFMKRLLMDQRFRSQGYKKFTVFVPVRDWLYKTPNSVTPKNTEDKLLKLDYIEDLNPMSTLIFQLKTREGLVSKEFEDVTFLFTYQEKYVKLSIKDLEQKTDWMKLKTALTRLIKGEVDAEEETRSTEKAIIHQVMDKLEVDGGVKITSIAKPEEPQIVGKDLVNKVRGVPDVKPAKDKNDVTEKSTEEKNKEARDIIVKKVTKAAATAKNVDDAIDQLDSEEDTKDLSDALQQIHDNTDGNVNISAARAKRMKALDDQFLKSSINKDGKKGRVISDLIESNTSTQPLPTTKLPIESINDGWHEMQFKNFEDSYDLDGDIWRCIRFFATRNTKISIYDPKVEDTSTTEDWKYTYSFKIEDVNGKRYSMKLDIPKLKANRFMKLGGNDKTISAQLVLIPISKTDEDTVQLCSNYNKIFIRRYGNGTGKSTSMTDKLVKTLDICINKYPNEFKAVYGSNENSTTKFKLPFDYTDLGTKYFKITATDKKRKFTLTFFFNQEAARKEYNIPDNNSKVVLGDITQNGKRTLLWYDDSGWATISGYIMEQLEMIEHFQEELDQVKAGTKHMYSRASILGTEMPVIVIMAYSEGLQLALKKAKITYEITDKRHNDYSRNFYEVIPFKDGYLYYKVDYASTLLMNGLKEIDTKSIAISEIDNKVTWIEALDNFGSRLKGDGLDNFYDLFMDPISIDVCKQYKLPTDYIELLAYSNLLLADNDYTKHTNISNNRYRTNELIAAYVYKCMATAFADYKNQLKRNRNVKFGLKQSVVLDAIMADPTMSDLSILNPLLEIEAKNSVSFKGLVGMNSDRSYSLDKRTFDDTMVNHIALSTGFAGNVGVNRNATINNKIYGARGYIQNSSIEEASVTNTLSMTEALTPFGSTRDDPFRTAMTNIQTQKHNMRIKKSMPLLVTCGADDALPYLTSDTFAFKAKMDGKVIKKNDEYMIVQYADKSKESIDLRENTKKNSDGGFYITIQLKTDYKAGDKFKENDILAYDPVVYSNAIGDKDSISFSIGALAKVAIMNTDEGFEDSAIISPDLSDDLTSEVVVEQTKNLPKDTNIVYIAKKGQPIQEGENLLIFSNAYKDEDANAIVRNLNMDATQVSELGRVPLKSKATGIVQDIKMYRTVELSEMSSSLRKLFKEHDAEIAKIKKDTNGCINDMEIEPDYKLPPTSKMKNLEGKVRFEFYIKYNDKMGIGDKLVFMSALKGETKDIFEKGKEPYSEYRPDEIVDSYVPNDSVLRRMVASVEILTGLYKAVIETTRQMQDILGIPWDYIHKRSGTSK